MKQQDKYQDILKRYWGYPDFRGIQREIIESIGAGRDTLGLMPTGGGKSLTFQIPALAQKGICIVITPLIALMKDQVDNLRKQGIKAMAIYSGMSRNEVITTLENCIFGEIKLLYISPERLSSELFQTKLKKMQVSFITVDEAHCISQWGYDFRPSYLEIANIRKLIPHAPVLALTATATPDVIDDIQIKLGFNEKNVFRMSFARENLSYIVRTAIDKQAELIHILKCIDGAGIVYVRSRKRAKEISELLCSNGLNTTYYHAGLEPSVKDQRQEKWQADKVRIMVATNAFGMGIDKPDVRVVIHIDIPSSLEAYFQEAGRAGRDGKRAYAVLLYNDSDEYKLRKRIEDTFPPKDANTGKTIFRQNANEKEIEPPKDNICDIYEHLAYFYQIGTGSGEGHTFEFNIDRFCTAFHHFPLHVNAALMILQRAGYIEYEQNPDTSAKVKFLLTRNDLYRLDETSGKENAVITALLRCYGGLFTDYAYIDESYIAQEAGLDQNQTYQILKILKQKRILDFIPRKNVPYITYSQDRVDGNKIVLSKEVYEDRKKDYEKRIGAVLKYAINDYECRSRQLLHYFGEDKPKDCGHCDVCLSSSKEKKKADKKEIETIKKQILEILNDDLEHHITEFQDLSLENALVKEAIDQLHDEETIFTTTSYVYKKA
ncbi:MAG: RecQ family ATP-dependent DNA helicase [Prevotella sp.]|nr:RecQ family ATP-dependent DNA helicase [Prevotella sp.]